MMTLLDTNQIYDEFTDAVGWTEEQPGIFRTDI